MTNLRALFVGFVWPEPSSSAAGVRTLSLVRVLQRAGWEIHFISPSPENEHAAALRALGVHARTQGPNDPAFDSYVADLKPELAIFDRFVMEEQFGWRVKEHSPETLRVLDTIDLHFLRRGREEALKQGVSLEDIFEARLDFRSSELGFGHEDALREIAAIYRSDLTLILSDFESALLKRDFGMPAELVLDLPFFFRAGDVRVSAPFEDRVNFVSIGNFRHKPNADSARWLREKLWPQVRARLPEAEVHLYGAYPTREMMALSNPAMGFFVKGQAEDSVATLQRYRVNLAPLRFGAGIKGKIADGWLAGTPTVTTPIGAEGMTASAGDSAGVFAGAVARTEDAFVEACVEFYTRRELWSEAQGRGFEALRALFDEDRLGSRFLGAIAQARAELSARRARNFTGAMLSHHQHRSTKYFSRWIEEKTKR